MANDKDRGKIKPYINKYIKDWEIFCDHGRDRESVFLLLTWSSEDKGSLLVENRPEIAGTAKSLGQIEAGQGERKREDEEVGQHHSHYWTFIERVGLLISQ